MDLEETNRCKKERIWLVNLFFGLGVAPTGVLLEGVAVGLTRAGFQVEVLTGRASYNRGSQSESQRFSGPVRKIFSGPAHSGGFVSRLLTWLVFYFGVLWFTFTHRNPDKVLVLTTPPFLLTIFVLRNVIARRKAQLILWNQDTYPDILGAVGLLRINSFLYRFLLGVQHWSTSRVHKVIVLDQAMKQRLEKHGATDIATIPNWGNDEPIFTEQSGRHNHQLSQRIEQARQTFKYVVVYTGNYGWGHQLRILFEWMSFHPGQSDFFFLFVGGGEKWKQLEELGAMIKGGSALGAQPLDVFPYVEASQYPALLDQADFGLVALEGRCLGLQSPSKIHSYLAHGKPLLYIGPKRSNVADAIEQYQCGFQVEENDVEGLERCLASLRAVTFDYEHYSEQARLASGTRYVERVGVSDVVAFIAGCDATDE